MARQSRGVQAGRSYLVMQRGHADQPFTRDDTDRQAYLDILLGAALGQGLWVHGWSILPTQAYVMVTPQRASALSATLQQLGRQYAQIFNRRWLQRGSPWDGRYRSCWVGEDQALASLIWLDQLAHRLGLVAQPADYPWSTAALLSGRGGERSVAGLRPLQAYWQLGNTPFERERAYGLLLEAPEDEALAAQLEAALRSGRPVLSASEWRAHPEEAIRWMTRPRGRPRRGTSPGGVESVPN